MSDHKPENETMNDDWNPNLLLAGIPEPCRIYGTSDLEICALVSPVDYQWCIRWRWSIKISRGGRKLYLRRNVHVALPGGGRIQKNLFLHRAIMDRTGIKPPSPEHTIVDHIDGDGLNCQRENLRWATPSENAKSAIRRKTYYHLFLKG